MIRVIELRSGLFSGSLTDLIEEAIKENNITRANLIDIKYSSNDGASSALIIYEE